MIHCLVMPDELLKKAKIASLYTGRLHKILMVVFKSLFFSTYPGYLKEVFVSRNSSYSLRGNKILTLYLNQEQQTMDLSASDIKLQKFRIRSQTV